MFQTLVFAGVTLVIFSRALTLNPFIGWEMPRGAEGVMSPSGGRRLAASGRRREGGGFPPVRCRSREPDDAPRFGRLPFGEPGVASDWNEGEREVVRSGAHPI
jgi:hypothetical protein